MSVEQQVKEVIAQTLSLTPQEITLDGKLSEALDVDSTEAVDLRVALEKAFAVKIDAKEITKQSTPKDIIGVLESKKGGS